MQAIKYDLMVNVTSLSQSFVYQICKDQCINLDNVKSCCINFQLHLVTSSSHVQFASSA